MPTYKDVYMILQDNNITNFLCGKKLEIIDHTKPYGMRNVPDAQLLSLSAQGNKLAFEYFYDRHERRIYNKALNKCQDIALAAQLVQDVFVKLYLRLLESKNPERYQIGYIYKMLETTYIDHLRSYQNKTTLSLDVENHDDYQSHNDSPHTWAEQDDIIRMLTEPLLKAKMLVNAAQGSSEKKLALHRKNKVANDVKTAIETFDQLYRYGYSMQEMAINLGLTLEQVKYRDKKLLDMVKSGLKKIERLV
jgi:RNA polymerase sigma factor (sigma-70 family)